MKTADAILTIQTALLIPEAERRPMIGPKTRARFERLAVLAPDADWILEAEAPSIVAGRHISADGLQLVKEFEGLRLDAYKDEVGVWTIGWGHTGLQHKDGTVHNGREITIEQAEELLRYDMNQFESRVATFVKVPLNDDEFAALVAFDFNTGGLGRSTLLKRLNAGDRAAAADQFLVWNKAGGEVLRGLTRRRQSERNLFLSRRPFIVEG